MSVLNKIKERPDNQKKVLSLFLASILTLVILGVWWSFNNNSEEKELAQNQDSKLSSISPVQVIKDEFSRAFSNFNDNLESETSSTTVEVEVVEVTEATSTATSTDSVDDLDISTTSDSMDSENLN